MVKLHQILPVEKDAKAQAFAALKNADHLLEKQPLLSGISRTYRPKEDGGDPLPPESTRVQVRAGAVIADVVLKMTRAFDAVATKETANRNASADLVVGDVTLLDNVPVAVLLFLEKQLVSLNTFIRRLPVLDPSEQWEYDETTDTWSTEPFETTRSKKLPRSYEKAPATEHHKAQVEMYFEDVIVGTWTTVKRSGALPAARIKILIERVETLQRAVKMAREAANTVEVEDVKIGRRFFDFLFA
ncbi:hypothetical protein SAMN05421837_107403 [Amycolatopsis pretoriensis]|uniref:Uncharacterized protein n=3 Tax=Amycolatopsis pretoriensis TaxID=218821 RepID=A0A1H5R7U1_9PSEU|nr:hypothetical protein [Amycolatopsis pretoriensis]SEF34470.1 hypothetical protein SAMN05421837_107403 [Amycolatopsis pretoriensis]